jgi:hypothetical protein
MWLWYLRAKSCLFVYLKNRNIFVVLWVKMNLVATEPWYGFHSQWRTVHNLTARYIQTGPQFMRLLFALQSGTILSHFLIKRLHLFLISLVVASNWGFPWHFSVLPAKRRASTSIRPLLLPSKSFPIHYCAIRCYTSLATDCVVE